MAKHLVLKDATSRAEYIFIQNSSLTTGAGLTGLVFNTASLVAYYVRPLGSATAITLATQTVTGAYSSGGFVEVDTTNMPGVYRLDVPNAVFATGVDKAVVMLKGATNMAPVLLEYQLTGFDPAALTWMASYTQPSGFLAATFPAGTIASTTNITAGTIATVTTVTGLTASNLDAAITSRATPAQVNTEVVDALNVDTYAEPGQATPAATATLAAKINYIYKSWRNRKAQTSTTYSLYNDDAVTVDQKATVSDDGTTAGITEMTTGP